MTNTHNLRNLPNLVGAQAISTIDFNSWTQNTASTKTQKSKKTRGVKDVVHPIFTTYADVTIDPFWKEKFTNAGYGKFPQKFTYHDGILFFRKGTKTFNLELSEDHNQAVYDSIQFFKNYGGIFSSLDQQNSLDQSLEHVEELVWAGTSKKVQECLISHFVTDKKEQYRLNVIQTNQLRQTVKFGVYNKYFGKQNIVMASNRIEQIIGLLYDEKNKFFSVDPKLPCCTRRYTRKREGVEAGQKDMTPQFYSKWLKYVDYLTNIAEQDELKESRTLRKSELNNLTHPRFKLLTESTEISETSETSDSEELFSDEE